MSRRLSRTAARPARATSTGDAPLPGRRMLAFVERGPCPETGVLRRYKGRDGQAVLCDKPLGSSEAPRPPRAGRHPRCAAAPTACATSTGDARPSRGPGVLRRRHSRRRPTRLKHKPNSVLGSPRPPRAVRRPKRAARATARVASAGEARTYPGPGALRRIDKHGGSAGLRDKSLRRLATPRPPRALRRPQRVAAGSRTALSAQPRP